MTAVSEVIPWLAIAGFFGLMLRVRVSGDPALWKRVEALEAKLEANAKEFEKKLADERRDCAKKLADMEGQLRDLEQQLVSSGRLSINAVAGPLHSVFRPDYGDKDSDVIAKLEKLPGTGRPRAKKR